VNKCCCFMWSDDVLSDDTNTVVPPAAVLQDDEMMSSLVTEEADTAAAAKSNEPSVQCLAAELLSTWRSLKVSIFLCSYDSILLYQPSTTKAWSRIYQACFPIDSLKDNRSIVAS